MDIRNIKEEQDLRQWLSEGVNAWNKERASDRLGHVWIEPGFGGSTGVSDAKLTFRGQEYGVELKHFHVTSKGVCYKIRPVQRRYNVMGVREGKKLVILATIDRSDYVDLVLIRGDNCPLRDYCKDLGSGCEQGIKQLSIQGDRPFYRFIASIADPNYWPSLESFSKQQLPIRREQ
jgi:hypothetical protein